MRVLLWLGLMIISPVLNAETVDETPVLPPTVETAPLKTDLDGDGKLSLEEFKAARLFLIEQEFAQMDTNQDGYVDTQERQHAIEQIKAQLESMRPSHVPNP